MRAGGHGPDNPNTPCYGPPYFEVKESKSLSFIEMRFICPIFMFLLQVIVTLNQQMVHLIPFVSSVLC